MEEVRPCVDLVFTLKRVRDGNGKWDEGRLLNETHFPSILSHLLPPRSALSTFRTLHWSILTIRAGGTCSFQNRSLTEPTARTIKPLLRRSNRMRVRWQYAGT